MSITLWWVVAMLALLAAEALVPGFILFFFGIGAAVTALVSLFIDNWLVLAPVFLCSSLASLLLFRTTMVHVFRGDENMARGNSAATPFYVGKTATVTQPTGPDRRGEVSLNGSFWRALSDAPLPEGTVVVVLGTEANDSLTLRVAQHGSPEARAFAARNAGQ